MKQQHDEMMTRIRAELYGNDPREAVIAELRAQLATANEARQQLQEALSVRNTQLATVTQRAEAAEQQLMVYRVLLTNAMMTAASEFGRLDGIKDFANEYFELLFDAALQSGAFVEAQCGSVGILRVAEQLNVVLEEE